MNEQATSLGYAILGLLHVHGGAQTGYALQKIFEDTPMRIYSGSPGAIYPALQRLEENGLVAGATHDVGPVKRARGYRPTTEGTRALRDHVTRPIERRDVESGMDELMLRFVFLGLVADAAATQAFLDDLEAHLESYLDELNANASQLEEKGAGMHARLALEAGLQTYRAHLRWARAATAALERGGFDRTTPHMGGEDESD